MGLHISGRAFVSENNGAGDLLVETLYEDHI